MVDLSEKWKIKLNDSKCHVIHFGKNNPRNVYTMGSGTLEEIEEEKDLGVTIHKSAKSSNQCIKAAKKGNQVLGQLARVLISKDQDTIMRLYKTYVRPHLEYSTPVWSPYLQKDIQVLERVQRRATRMISGVGKKLYDERLAIAGLTTLEERRLRGDMIEVFKMKTGLVRTSLELKMVSDSHSMNTRGSAQDHMEIQRANTEQRRHFFTQRVANPWNGLPTEVRGPTSLNGFKNVYDKFKSTGRHT